MRDDWQFAANADGTTAQSVDPPLSCWEQALRLGFARRPCGRTCELGSRRGCHNVGHCISLMDRPATLAAGSTAPAATLAAPIKIWRRFGLAHMARASSLQSRHDCGAHARSEGEKE